MDRYRLVLHAISWGIPCVVIIITLIYHRFGHNPCAQPIWWCWITPKDGDQRSAVVLWQLFAGKLWEMASYVVVCCLYAVVKFKLAQHVCMRLYARMCAFVCMYVCACMLFVCMRLYAHRMYAFVCTSCVCVCMHACMHLYAHANAHLHARVYEFVRLYVCAFMLVCMYVYLMHFCMYVCMQFFHGWKRLVDLHIGKFCKNCMHGTSEHILL